MISEIYNYVGDNVPIPYRMPKNRMEVLKLLIPQFSCFAPDKQLDEWIFSQVDSRTDSQTVAGWI